MKKQRLIFLLVASLVLLLFFLADWLNGRLWMNDFKVFYGAAEAWVDGGDVYGDNYGLDSGYFKYTPVILLLFIPFTLLEYGTASVLFYAISAMNCAGGILLIERLFSQTKPNWSQKKFLLMFISLLAVGKHFFRELHLGNVNMLIVFVLVSALLLLRSNKLWWSALLVVLVIFTKPYFALLALPILVFGKWNVLWRMAICGIGLLLLSVVAFGWEGSISMHQQWASSVATHNKMMESPNTVFYFFESLFGLDGSGAASIFYGVCVVALCAFFFYRFREDTASDSFHWFALLFFIVLAMAPTFLITDTEHFLFSLPLIMVVLNDVQTQRAAWKKVAFIAIVLLYGFNISELVTMPVALFLNELGVLGIANLGILIWSIALLFGRQKERESLAYRAEVAG